MPKVQISIPHKRVELPSFSGSEVILKKLTVGEQRSIREKYGLTSTSNIESKEAEDAMFELVETCIVERNLYNGDEKVQINKESLNTLPQEDIQFLIATVMGVKIPGQEKNE